VSSLLSERPWEDGLLHDIEESSRQNVYACNQCGKCTAACPFSLVPQQVVHLLQLGEAAAALAHGTTWDCASCLTCAVVCPKGVSPARIQRALRTVHLRPIANGNGNSDGQAPGGVDLGRCYRAHAHPLRAALLGHIHRLSRVGSALAPFSNWALGLPPAKLVADHVLGIHRARSFPAFVRRPFPVWFRTHTPQGDGHRGTVLLFHDTFMDFNYPAQGIAATHVLEKAGFRVELTDHVCCGRPMISKGLVAQAATQARTNVARLWEPARRGLFIVGCEPSCLLTLRDDYPELVDDPELRSKARVVAQQALLIDEFLGMLNAKGELGLSFREAQDNARPVVFHGHCHQKASADPARSVELLRLAGYQTEMLQASCCGMAGAFGYEKEHYEVSRAAGERALFPLIRENSEAQVAVMGVSCRQQIEHFTGRHPRHMVELLSEALV